ncbi:hypothetical protein BKA70DRAFT_829840 [Coprinopsis sp. MPI-PUGE-AT-0042]|nr:hypothetical protein BKA70DRAFT_829840 [Coprinopsis sp. MPI-PUGE-AT-0042]
MDLIASTIGAELMALVLQTFIYGIVTYQYATYFLSDFKDPRWITWPMGCLYLLNSFHVASIIYLVWYDAVVNFGNMGLFAEPKAWPFPTSTILTSVSAFVAQLFLIYRAYRLAFRSKLRIFYVIPLVILSLAAFGLGLTVSVKVFLLKSTAELSTLNPLLTGWLTLEVATDVCTAGLLLWTLWDSKTHFKRTGKIIQRLLRTAVQTGVLMSVFAGITMILFLTFPNSEFVFITGVPIGCVYCLTLMDTLLCRKDLRAMIEDVETNNTPSHSQAVSRALASLPRSADHQPATWSFQTHDVPLMDINKSFSEKKPSFGPTTSTE